MIQVSSGDLQQRLLRENGRAVGQRMHLAGESEAGQVIEKRPGELTGFPKPGQVIVAEAQFAQELDHVLDAARHDEISVVGKIAIKQAEGRRFEHALGDVSLGHGQLVHVGEKRCAVAADTGIAHDESILKEQASKSLTRLAIIEPPRRPGSAVYRQELPCRLRSAPGRRGPVRANRRSCPPRTTRVPGRSIPTIPIFSRISGMGRSRSSGPAT